MSKEKAHSAVARPFVNWYESLPWDQRGLIEDAMRDVLRAVEDNVQPGSMTLVIKIQPKGKRKVVLSPSVSTKLPRPKLEASSAWIDLLRVTASDWDACMASKRELRSLN